MKKRILSIVLALALLICMIPMGMLTASALIAPQKCGNHSYDAHDLCTNCAQLKPGSTHPGWTAWTSTTSLPTKGYYYLTDDVTMSKGVDLSGDLWLDLNGKTVTFSGSVNDVAIDIKNSAGLYLYASGGGVIQQASTASYTRGMNVVVGVFYMYGGEIRNFKSNDNGGFLYLGTGTFCMYGGKITNCSAIFGGAVYIKAHTSSASASMRMYGGTLEGNTAVSYGGAIANDGLSLTVYGGEFISNKTTGATGGCSGGAIMTMNGGKTTIAGAAKFVGNEADRGGALSLISSGSTLSINGAEISNSSAYNGATGVHVYGGTVTYTSGRFSTDDTYSPNPSGTSNITLNPNNGSGGTASISSQKWHETLPAIVTPTRAGYTFTGYTNSTGEWYYKADGTAYPKYYGGANWDYIGDQTLYAQWSQDQTLTYDANGHGTAPSAVTMTYTEETKAATMEAVTGYTFNGWNTEANGTGTAYQPGDTVKSANLDPKATTLYAQWSANVYAVTLNTDGTCDALTAYTYGVGATLPTPTNGNHYFLGWYDNADFTGAPITAIADDETGDKEFFAKWATVLYEYELTGAPTLGGEKDGTYSISTYYLDDAGEKVYIEKNRNTDVAISFESWYLRTMYQYRTIDGQLDIRFVSMLNDLIDDYAEAGFVFRIDELDWEETVTTNEVYTSFKASEIDQYIADYSRENDYFFLQNTLFSEDVVKEGYTVTVYAFVTTKDGTTYHGAPITIDLADLI